MANWLQKIFPVAPSPASKTNLPVITPDKIPPVATSQTSPQPASLPQASIIYAIAASALFVIAVYFLLTGRWFTCFLIMLPAFCFLGFALYYVKAK
jgi:hypothetical protein